MRANLKSIQSYVTQYNIATLLQLFDQDIIEGRLQ